MTDLNDDPPRLAESSRGRGLGPLFLAACTDIATDQELAMLATRLGPALGFAPALAQGVSMWAKLGSAALVGVLGAGGAFYVHTHAPAQQHEPAAPAAILTARAPDRAAPPPDNGLAAPSAPAAEPVPNAVTAPQASTASAPHLAAPHPNSARVDEATLLEHARSELASNPAHALALTAEDAKNYPGGVLAQEREVIAITALRRLGRTAEAEQRAENFDRSYPNSAHQRSVAADSAK